MLVDFGFVYDLIFFWEWLVWDMEGELIGYDFWDMDFWFYDGDMFCGVFLFICYGIVVVFVLVMEVLNVVFVFFCYFRFDMSCMV